MKILTANILLSFVTPFVLDFGVIQFNVLLKMLLIAWKSPFTLRRQFKLILWGDWELISCLLSQRVIKGGLC